MVESSHCIYRLKSISCHLVCNQNPDNDFSSMYEKSLLLRDECSPAFSFSSKSDIVNGVDFFAAGGIINAK